MAYRFVDSFRAAAGSGWNCSSILSSSRIRMELQFHPFEQRSRMELQFHPGSAARKLSKNL
jgi:hypothetical protein